MICLKSLLMVDGFLLGSLSKRKRRNVWNLICFVCFIIIHQLRLQQNSKPYKIRNIFRFNWFTRNFTLESVLGGDIIIPRPTKNWRVSVTITPLTHLFHSFTTEDPNHYTVHSLPTCWIFWIFPAKIFTNPSEIKLTWLNAKPLDGKKWVRVAKMSTRGVGKGTELLCTWRIIPFSKWLITMVSKSPKWGYSPYKRPKWLVNRGY